MFTSDSNFTCLIFRANHTEPCQMSLIYGPFVLSLRPQFLDLLQSVHGSLQEDWLIIGDFNMTLSSQDKLGGRIVSGPSRSRFRQFVVVNALIDICFIDSPYTWNNRRRGTANVQECIDIGFVNFSRRLHFQLATITHL